MKQKKIIRKKNRKIRFKNEDSTNFYKFLIEKSSFIFSYSN